MIFYSLYSWYARNNKLGFLCAQIKIGRVLLTMQKLNAFINNSPLMFAGVANRNAEQ